ncbi:PP0621 family protein [Ottowia sp.]|uniref:PP0621 family protein n=1 Tax=Ottowia sp. TaxID=1898956 RepID=UPI003A8C4603
MKLLAVLLAILAGVWLWQRSQRLRQNGDGRAAPRTPPTLPMVRCAHCGTHIPGNEVVPGHQGSYCSAAHRRDAEGA